MARMYHLRGNRGVRYRPDDDLIQCRICGRWFKSLTFHLVNLHQVAPREYKEEYGVRYVWSKRLRREATYWDKRRIIQELRRRWDHTHDLSIAAIQGNRHPGGVHGAAWTKFGSYRAAVEAAGFDYDKIRKYKRWSRRRIVEVLQGRIARGLPINYKAIFLSKDRPLLGSAIYHFVTFGGAVRAAGFPYHEQRRDIRWSKSEVIRRLRERVKGGKRINQRALKDEDSRLLSAACSWFGSLGKAIGAAGFDYEKMCLRRRWDRPKVLRAIRERHRAGQPLNGRDARQEAPALFSVAWTRFGGWRQAVEAAGIDYDKVSKQMHWSRPKIVAAIRGHAAKGHDMRREGIHREEYRLVRAAERYFGAWPKALRTAFPGVKLAYSRGPLVIDVDAG